MSESDQQEQQPGGVDSAIEPDGGVADAPRPERPSEDTATARASTSDDGADDGGDDVVDEREPGQATGADADIQTGSDTPAPAEEDRRIGERRRGDRRIHTVDFSQPTKFTTELRRRILRVLGPFCEAYANRLSSELRAPVELVVTDSEQLTWSAAKAAMPTSDIAVALEVNPVDRRMLLSVEPPLILRALECLLGGNAAEAPAKRHFSEIDWALTRRLLEATTAHLSTAWRDLGGLSLVLGEIDLEDDAGVIFPLGEATFAITLECRVDGLLSRMSLFIPWSAIEPVAGEVLGGGSQLADADPQDGHAVNRSLAASRVRVRAEVGSAMMPVEQMLALTPGTLLALEDRAEDGVHLFAEGVPIGRARPGLRGARRALKLNAPIEPGPVLATHAVKASKPTGPSTRAPVLESTGSPGPDEANGERNGGAPPDSGSSPTREGLARMLGVSVRVWAELGRATLPLGNTLGLLAGAVVELDQAAEAPIELFVNGLCFAHGTLQVTAGGDWAVHVDALV